VIWTPTVLIADPQGHERWRLEGYLSKAEFRTNLEMGLGRVAIMHKNWHDAEHRYDSILEKYPDSLFAPEAIYWRGISRYKTTNDHNTLGEVAEILNAKYPDSIWTLKALPWSQ
jgi:outer membrane protein assembly factor BamD (BamD/ComL family)